MTVREFYSEIGGNYDDMISALGKEERIGQFIKMFPEENILDGIKNALNEKDYHTAFRGAHNLKGMSINVGLKQLHKLASDLTESLRNGPVGDVDGLYELVENEYNRTCELIKDL